MERTTRTQLSRAYGVGSAAAIVAFLAVGGGTASASGLGPSPTQSASTPTCGQVLIGRTAWLGGYGVDVKSNGTHDGTALDCSPKPSYVDGVLAGRRWQCAELVNRLYLTRGWISATWSGDAGKPMWAQAPAGLVKERNGGVSYLAGGDVVDIDEYYDKRFVSGHVFVVNTTRQVRTGSVGLVSQNNSGVAQKPGTLAGGTVVVGGSGSGWTYRVIGVIHAP